MGCPIDTAWSRPPVRGCGAEVREGKRMSALERLAARVLAAAVVGLACAGLSAAPSDDAIEGRVARVMETFEVPGMAVAVVHEGETLLASGYGIAEIGAGERVDDRTLFRIGSVSKAFTAAALAILVDEGKLSWNDPVIDHLPPAEERATAVAPTAARGIRPPPG